MSLVAKERPSIRGSSKLVAVVTLHMDRGAAQETALDESPHTTSDMAELVIMSRGYLEASLVRQGDQSSSLSLVECKRFLHINVASPFQTSLGNIEMAFGGCCDVNDVRSGFTQKCGQVAEIPLDREP